MPVITPRPDLSSKTSPSGLVAATSADDGGSCPLVGTGKAEETERLADAGMLVGAGIAGAPWHLPLPLTQLREILLPLLFPRSSRLAQQLQVHMILATLPPHS